MRIGLIAPPWCSVPPRGYGGTETVIDALARGLKGLGHQVLLLATGDSTCPVPTRSVLAAAEGTRMGQLLPELRHVAYAYDQVGDCDVVHDHTLSGALRAWGADDLPPVVVTNHSPFQGELLGWYRQVATRVPVLAISRAQAAPASAFVHRVIHHGLVPEDYPVGPGGGPLLFLGRMSPDKGVHRAIQAARRAGCPLLIAAKMRLPEEHAYFDDAVRPLLGDGVEFLGEVAGQDKLALLGAARALLMPIRWPEPFGLVMIEALACGTPVLAFKEGATAELVSHGVTGWLCSDEADMADAAARIDDLDRAACRRAVETAFSAERMARDHLEVYAALQGSAGLRQRAPGLPDQRDLGR